VRICQRHEREKKLEQILVTGREDGGELRTPREWMSTFLLCFQISLGKGGYAFLTAILLWQCSKLPPARKKNNNNKSGREPTLYYHTSALKEI